MTREEKYDIIVQSAVKGIENTINMFNDKEMAIIGYMVSATISRFFQNEELANDNCRILDNYSLNGLEANKQKKLK